MSPEDRGTALETNAANRRIAPRRQRSGPASRAKNTSAGRPSLAAGSRGVCRASFVRARPAPASSSVTAAAGSWLNTAAQCSGVPPNPSSGALTAAPASRRPRHMGAAVRHQLLCFTGYRVMIGRTVPRRWAGDWVRFARSAHSGCAGPSHGYRNSQSPSYKPDEMSVSLASMDVPRSGRRRRADRGTDRAASRGVGYERSFPQPGEHPPGWPRPGSLTHPGRIRFAGRIAPGAARWTAEGNPGFEGRRREHPRLLTCNASRRRR